MSFPEVPITSGRRSSPGAARLLRGVFPERSRRTRNDGRLILKRPSEPGICTKKRAFEPLAIAHSPGQQPSLAVHDER